MFNFLATHICTMSRSHPFHVPQGVICPLSTDEATPGVLRPAPSSPVQDRAGLTGVSPAKDQQDDKGTGASNTLHVKCHLKERKHLFGVSGLAHWQRLPREAAEMLEPRWPQPWAAHAGRPCFSSVPASLSCSAIPQPHELPWLKHGTC